MNKFGIKSRLVISIIIMYTNSITISPTSLIPYEGKLWCHENLVKLMTDQKFTKFSLFNFLYIYKKVKSHVSIVISAL